MELNLEELLSSIKTEFNGSVDDFWDNRFMDLQLDMEIIGAGEYSENIEYFIEDENGNSHDAFEFLESRVNY